MRRRHTAVMGAAVAAAMMMSGCAGGIGQSGSGAEGESGDGVDYGASKEEFQAALEDMSPVTLKFQASSTASGHSAERDQAFADYVEDWSGGKISIEVIYGQPIAPYGETIEAVADRRLDIAIEVPIYTPEKYPLINDLSVLSTSAAAGPVMAEVVGMAAAQEFAWNDEDLLAEYRDKGVEPFIPVEMEFSNALLCTEKTTELDDFPGKQIRAGTTTAHDLAEALGAAGVSLQSAELFEALERGTVSCMISSLKTAGPQGVLSVAPEIVFPEDVSWGRSPTSWVTGPKFAEMPLPARQLVFDQLARSLGDAMATNVKWAVDAAAAVDENDGGFYKLGDEAEDVIRDRVTEMYTDGSIKVMDGEQAAEELDGLLDKWTAIAQEEGIEEVDSWEALAESEESDPIDFSGFSQRLFEEVYLPHRPS